MDDMEKAAMLAKMFEAYVKGKIPWMFSPSGLCD